MRPGLCLELAENLIVQTRPKRFGRDKTAMTKLFNVIACCQWLSNDEFEAEKPKIQVKIVWIAGKQDQPGDSTFFRLFYQEWQMNLKQFSREEFQMYAEALKAFYYFYGETRGRD